jgi:hypothetical protein
MDFAPANCGPLARHLSQGNTVIWTERLSGELLYHRSVIGLTDFLRSLGALLPSVGVLVAGWGVVYYVLQKQLEAKLASRLEFTKHELQLEYQKKSIVFEHQKDSFRNVLVAMHEAIEAIAGGDGPEWLPIGQDVVDKFRRVVSEEALFMDADSDHALRLFVSSMWLATPGPDPGDVDQEDIRRAHSQTEFISERLSDHFRFRVGLPPAHPSPLADVELLGACTLINRYHFSKHGLPTKGPLAIRPGETASELVATARQNLVLLRSELERLKGAVISDERHTSLFFPVRTEVEYYLTKLGGPTAKVQATSTAVR